MLEYDRIDISEGIDIKKCKETSKKCSICKKDAFNLIKNAVIINKKGTL